jgi:VCBS repeat-containing protein
LNVKAAADLLQAYRANPGARRIMEDRVTTTRTLATQDFTWDGVSPIRVTLCWTDPAGVAVTTSENRTARLVNNLNLQVVAPDGTTTYLPYVMPYVGDWSVSKLGAAAVNGVNNTDNVEQVYVASPGAAGNYQARVTFSGTLTNNTQQYSLLISGGNATDAAPAPAVATISPTLATRGPMTLTVTGANILLGATLKFSRSGNGDVFAKGIEVYGDGVRARLDASAMPMGTWDVTVINPDGQTATLPVAFTVPGAVWADNIENGTVGWTHNAPTGTDAWAVTTAESNSATHSFFAPGPASRAEDILISPVIPIPAGTSNLQFSFWHNYSFQSGVDGGILEFSVDGGTTYFGIGDAGSGASFASGEYTATLSNSGPVANRNPLAGKNAWTGTNNGWTQVIVNLTDASVYAGKNFRIRWRLGTNSSTASTGWYVDDAVLSGTSSGNQAPSITTPAAAVPSLVTGTSTQLSVAAIDDAGEAGLTYTWSVNDEAGAPIVFSANGTNAAKSTTATFSKAGTFTFTVTVRDAEGWSATSAVNVQVDQTLTTINVAPGSATVRVARTQQFGASALDQFARAMTSPPTIAWSVSGGGTVDSAGLFTAGLTPGGPFTLTAANGAVAGAASVVVAADNPPVAVNDAASGNEDSAIGGNVLTNDTDADSDALTALLVAGPSHGSLSLNGNGAFTYTPASNYFGADSFTYKANDGIADSNTATVSITVNAVNDVPVAFGDSFSGIEDTPIAGNVLTNDTDIDSPTLNAVQVAAPAHGNVTLNADGSFLYTPQANYFGPDSFTYRANDGSANSNVATVSLTVAAVNDAPLAANDPFAGNEDGEISGNVLANDADTEGNTLTAALISNVSHGALTLNTNGSFIYTPVANYFGPDSFTYRANDGALVSSIATVTLTVNAVNDAPVAADDAFSGAEDVAINGNVLANDSDLEGNPLTAVLISSVAHGALILNANGTFTYTPTPNYFGADAFTYRASDGSQSNVATVTFSLTPVDDAPLAANDAFSGNEDGVINGNVLANDADVEGSALTVSLVAGVNHGALTLNADGTFSYTPAQNYFGADSFTYKANDGAADSDVATVTLTVNAVNDAPVAVNDAYSGNEDTSITGNVLANDTDADSASLSATVVATPAHGTLLLNADGAFTYTPVANYFGPDTFTYKANDGLADSGVGIVTLTVNAVNDAPIALNDAFAGNEDGAINGNVLANDTDVDSASFSAIIVVPPAHGTLLLNADGTFTYTPAGNYFGPDSFAYRANDGLADSNVGTVTLTVNAVNDAPVAMDDTFSADEDIAIAGNVLANDTDVEGASLTVTLSAGPSHGALVLNADGTFTYTPAANYFGPDSFTYTTSDGAASSNNATVSLTLNAVNDAPITANDAFSGNEDTVIAGNVLMNDTDTENAPLTATLVTDAAHGTLALNADGSFTNTAAADYAGPDSFSYSASDGSGMSAPATVTLTVAAVNDAPIAVPDAFSGSQGVAVTGNVLTNDTDVEGNVLGAALVAAPANGALTLNPNGSFSYTANAGFTGNDSFTYKANDGSANSNVATVNLTISGELYSTWAAEHFTAEELAAGAGDESNDFDRDGLVNLMEYALGTDARVPNAGPTITVVPDLLGDPRLTLTYSRPAALPGLTYFVEASSDLSAWQPLAGAEVAVMGGKETVVARDSAVATGQTRRFMRLRVQRAD